MSDAPFDAYGRIDRRVERLEDWRRDVDRDQSARAERDKYVADELRELREAVEGVRKMFLTFTLTVAGAGLTFGLSILAATGRI